MARCVCPGDCRTASDKVRKENPESRKCSLGSNNPNSIHDFVYHCTYGSYHPKE